MKWSQMLVFLNNHGLVDFNFDGRDFFVQQICDDSRRVQQDSIFVAIQGPLDDGHKYLQSVLLKKPKVVLFQNLELMAQVLGRPSASFSRSFYESDILFVQASDTRVALGRMAAELCGRPSEKLFCVGVTGTNGKTTTSIMIEHIFNSLGVDCGVIGTIDHHIKNVKWNTGNTTPGALELQERLGQFVEHKAKACSMEVTSHALDQKRVDGVQFDCAIFTNLTRDHLDYHLDMQSYFAAKELLFNTYLAQSKKTKRVAVIHRDDTWGKKIKVDSSIEEISFGLKPVPNPNRHLVFEPHKFSLNGFHGRTLLYNSKNDVEECVDSFVPMVGEFNMLNYLAAVGAGLAAGLDLKDIVQQMRNFLGVRGRLQRVQSSAQRYVFVDYAHTDDALAKALQTLKQIRDLEFSQSRLIVVFGCGGDRDTGKRALMAKAAEAHADRVFVTSDNPRTEDPQSIVDDILAGFTQNIKKAAVHVELDREKAIEAAILDTKENDIVLIAGKGHEDYQIIGKEKIHFDDAEIAAKYL
jgi:UDP-N-acetylmuramoyl-L-alanyl-D-glutamate--2,6-diaminopimelate ligase